MIFVSDDSSKQNGCTLQLRVSAKRTLNLVDQDFLDSSWKTQFPLSGNVLVLSQKSLTMEQLGNENSKVYMVKYRKGKKRENKNKFSSTLPCKIFLVSRRIQTGDIWIYGQ